MGSYAEYPLIGNERTYQTLRCAPPIKASTHAVLVERDALQRVLLTQTCAGSTVLAPIQRHNRLNSHQKVLKSPLCWTILYGFTSSARQKCTVLHHKRTVSHRNRTLPQRVSRADRVVESYVGWPYFEYFMDVVCYE